MLQLNQPPALVLAAVLRVVAALAVLQDKLGLVGCGLVAAGLDQMAVLLKQPPESSARDPLRTAQSCG